MKKSIYTILVGIVTCGIVAGCSAPTVSQEEYNQLISELETANSKIEELTSGNTNNSQAEQITLPSPTTSPTMTYMDTLPKMDVGDSIETMDFKVYVDYSYISPVVVPPQTNGFYIYYEAEVNRTYVDVCFAYKNRQSYDVRADQVISAELKYDDRKYTYKGFSIIEEDNRSDFTYTNITSISPLSTEYIHYLFEMPAEIENNTKSIEILFTTIDGKDYIYTVR